MDIYVIQPGDTLAAVAARFGVSVDRLLEVNGLPHPDRLIPGQAVLIPEPPQHFLMYTVIPGDTLHKLAQLFNTSVQVIAEVNDIDNPDYIEAGSELVIPGWIGIEYTVRPGDTLWSIGRQFGVSPGLIARVNRIENPSLIFPWQALIIPQQVPDVIKQEIETLAYVFPDAASLREALDTAGQCLTYAAVFQFRVDGAGGLIEPEDAQATIEVCRQQGIAPLAVVTNWRRSVPARSGARRHGRPRDTNTDHRFNPRRPETARVVRGEYRLREHVSAGSSLVHPVHTRASRLSQAERPPCHYRGRSKGFRPAGCRLGRHV
jgi:spore germination protein